MRRRRLGIGSSIRLFPLAGKFCVPLVRKNSQLKGQVVSYVWRPAQAVHHLLQNMLGGAL